MVHLNVTSGITKTTGTVEKQQKAQMSPYAFKRQPYKMVKHT